LPGTGGPPAGYGKIQTVAAQAGFHVIGLVYPNDVGVNTICSGQPSDCPENARVEIVTGQNVSSLVNVNRANSIENRLYKLLKYLAASYPSEGWGSYISGSDTYWSKVIIAGHSQGGGHAAMVAKLHVVSRALLFSSTEPADWTSETHLTATSGFYGFADAYEVNYGYFAQSWLNLGIPGILSSVDLLRPPFNNSHQLTTIDAPVVWRSGDPYHGVVVTDTYTPLASDGSPLFKPVWLYMLGDH
jgi:hypothetical protein